MKKLKYLVLMMMLLVVPFVAFAEDEVQPKEEDNRAVVYFFHGATCPHCLEAEEWFDSIQEEYGDKFVIKAYEVWNDEANANIMQQVSDARGDNATGVPYIIIGDKSWIGFAEETYGPEIISQIEQVYETPVEERYDVLSLVEEIEVPEKSTASDVIALIIILVVVGGIGYAIYAARKTTN